MQGSEVLVALDGSPLPERALPVALALADACELPIRLVTVLPSSSEPGAARDVREYLDGVAARVAAHARVVHRSLVLGDPASTLRDLAKRDTVSVTVLTTHGRNGLARAIMGSVADSLVRTIDGPLLLWHPDNREFVGLRRILVPLDGTAGGAVALSTAVPLARATGAELVTVRVATPPPVWIYEPTIGLNTGPFINPMWAADARIAVETYAQAVAGRLRAAGITAEGRGESGEPAAALVSVASEIDADLIVMSTHRRGAARPFLGSVADQVVRTSTRPVLLVRRSGAYPHPLGPPDEVGATTPTGCAT